MKYYLKWVFFIYKFQFEQENEQLFQELNNVVDEVK